MLKTKAFLRKLTIAAIAAVVFVSVAGCQKKTDGNSILTTKKGFKAESFLPASTLVMFKIGTDDKTQGDNFKKIISLFAGTEDTFYKVFEQSFNDNMKDAGVSFVTDILGTFGENPRAVVALFTKDSALQQNDQTQSQMPDAQVSLDDLKQFGAVVAVEDTQSLDILLQKLVDKLQYTTTDYNGVKIYTKANDVLAPDGDTLLIASDVEVMKKLIDTHNNPQNSLLVDDQYQASIKNLQPNIAFLFIKDKDFLVFLNKLNTQLAANGAKGQMVLKDDYLNLVSTQSVIFTAENDGISMKSNVASDPNISNQNGFKFSDFPKHTAYMYQKVGGINSIIFTEGYNLAKSLELETSMYQFDENLLYMANMVKGVISRQGLDYDKDMAPLLTSGHAFKLSYNGGVFPNVGFYFDVSGKNDAAKAFLDKLHALIDKGLQTYFAKNPQFQTLLLNVKDEKSPGYEYVLAANLKDIFKAMNSDQLKVIQDNDFALRYGVNNDVLYLDFNFGKREASQPLSGDAELLNLKQKLSPYDAGFLFVNPINLGKMVDDIFNLAAKNNQGFAATSTDAYNSFKSALGHFTGLLLEGTSDPNTMSGAGYLQLK